MIGIVEGGAGDIAAMMHIMHDAFDPRFGEAWTAAQCLSTLVLPDCQLLLAKDDGDICGFAMSRWVFDHQELLMIGVARRLQGQNIGKLLLSETIHQARNAGRTKIFLEVRDGNNAQGFYLKSGFTPIGRRKNYYKNAVGIDPDAITMLLEL
ncbi:ribosomal protein S18-alanine N-acetyltransferase [Sphingorhabdus sp. EL138]|uniref:ribosomal protein S18-alanine N-acetyltransferase n=1 Tax=Sphingorhabdus sp. EL138 TaxID=2073156 RepID=UPI0025CC2EE7|nr:ribosomal protein S18-alanine N-acetyltransferase [Sphingorhabdus sp. EL138]